jgi:hypothetical protein
MAFETLCPNKRPPSKIVASDATTVHKNESGTVRGQ